MPTPLTLWWKRQAARYHYRSGLNQTRKRNLTEAIAAFDRALTHHSRIADVSVARGLACWTAGDRRAALADFELAIAHDPHHAPAYGNRGLLRYQLGDVEGALADWNAALTHHPTYADVYYNRGLVYLHRGQAERALKDFDQALTINPNLAGAYYHRGTLRDQLGDRPGAVRDWKLAVCNDLSLQPAKEKLLDVRRENYDRHLSDSLQTALDLPDTTVEAQHRGNRIDIAIHRALGATINYMALPNQIRTHLLRLRLGHIRQFRLIGRVGDQTLPEWRQIYPLHNLHSCPPSHWRMALLTLLVFPPLGIAAAFYAAEVKASYQRGEPQSAMRASNAVRGLWVLSRGIVSVFVVAGLCYVGFLMLRPSAFNMDPQPPNTFRERLRSHTPPHPSHRS